MARGEHGLLVPACCNLPAPLFPNSRPEPSAVGPLSAASWRLRKEPAVLGDHRGAPVLGGSGEKPTFDSHVDALADGELRLDEDTLHRYSPSSMPFCTSVSLRVPFSNTTAVVVGQQEGVFIPLDGVVGVADDPAVIKGVPPSHGRDVPRRMLGGLGRVRKEEEDG